VVEGWGGVLDPSGMVCPCPALTTPHPTPLPGPCCRAQPSAVRCLMLPQRHDVTPLIIACENGHPTLVALLLEHGAEPNHARVGGVHQ
jgi:hypothetical protein